MNVVDFMIILTMSPFLVLQVWTGVEWMKKLISKTLKINWSLTDWLYDLEIQKVLR